MDKKLVIVESPAKAKTIGKILGAGFVVKASMGHVRDLPIKKLGVDIEHEFRPTYVTVKGREKIMQELAHAAKGCVEVLLAPDPDREGEAIAWHLRELLKDVVPEESFRRVTYNEITPTAVRKAFDNPREIDKARVDAQQARRILDRIVGYKVRPLLWSRVRKGLSAGRVQSVALRLVCEREELIRNFVPQEYWLIGAVVRKLIVPLDPFPVRLARIDDEKPNVRNEAEALAILKDLEDRQLQVSKITRRELVRRAPPPYITSTLQQAASRVCGFSPDRTMRLAQRLYEGVDLGEGPTGLITYMRTDSFSVSQDAQQACLQLIREKYGPDYVPEKPNVFRSRASAQEAHEAIRPTDVRRTPESLHGRVDADELRLYALICQRFIASQMAPARIDQRTVDVEALPPAGTDAAAGAAPVRHTYLFRATASQVTFPGYMKVAGGDAPAKDRDDDKDEAAEEVDQLPPLQEGEPLMRMDWLKDRKETQPPGRYSEASLIRALEENGIGRPSTYAQIITTLHDRRYVTREKKALMPTDVGMQVSQLLVSTLNELFDVTFTAQMEDKLDKVESGEVVWTGMLAEFYGQFQEWMVRTASPKADPAKVQTLLAALAKVTTWVPGVQRGKRMYSDEKFVASVKEQFDAGEKALSERQLEALARLAWRYRDQIPDAAPTLVSAGFQHVTEAPPPVPVAPPDAATLRKLELLVPVQCDPPQKRRGRTYDDRKFIDSLRQQATGGRGLSPAQLAAVDRLVLRYAAQIPNFEAIKPELALDAPQPVGAEDRESGPLLEALKQVKEWKPATQRGRRVMDDKAFIASLTQQFERRPSLSPKQRAALKRVVARYRDQVPGAAELLGGEGTKAGPSSAPAPAAGGPGAEGA